MSALAVVEQAPGLGDYLDRVDARLAEAIGDPPGIVARVGADALAAGGKRLRPVLAYLSAPEGAPEPIAAGVAVELVHMATLLPDDLIHRAAVRRGRPAAWTAHGPPAARGAGDFLFARAFSELAGAGDRGGGALLPEASLRPP